MTAPDMARLQAEADALRVQTGVLDADVRPADGAIVAVGQLLTGLQLTLRRPGSPPGTYDECWDYPPDQLGGDESASFACATDFVALMLGREPAHWYRHRPSNRRRPGGDPNKEVVRP